MTQPNSTALLLDRRLRSWFNGFVGSDEERYVADALTALVNAAASNADSDVHLAASLSSLDEALRRAKA